MSGEPRRSGRARKPLVSYNEYMNDEEEGDEDFDEESEDDDDRDLDFGEPRRYNDEYGRKKGRGRPRGSKNRSSTEPPPRVELTEEELAMRRKRKLERIPKGMRAIPQETRQLSSFDTVSNVNNGAQDTPMKHSKKPGPYNEAFARSVTSSPVLLSPVRSTSQITRSESGSQSLSGVSVAQSSISEKKQKRPKLRKQNSSMHPDGIDFSPPTNTQTCWNASEVIKGFLFIGAGHDLNGRCLVNRPEDSREIKQQRKEFCMRNRLCYALNMAGSPLQTELKGIKYVLSDTIFKVIDMNDLDTWNEEEMVKGFEEGAAFIERAFQKHRKARVQSFLATGGTKIIPPTILVHCVAGVNRSPMCVVWWLSRFHGIHIDDAWKLIRLRRDEGAYWKDVTLGGEVPPEGYEPSTEELESAKTRKFQHRYDRPPSEQDEKEDHDNKETQELARPQVKYPKSLWYINAKRLLSKYFKWRVALDGKCDEIPGASPAHPSEPVLAGDVAKINVAQTDPNGPELKEKENPDDGESIISAQSGEHKGTIIKKTDQTEESPTDSTELDGEVLPIASGIVGTFGVTGANDQPRPSYLDLL